LTDVNAKNAEVTSFDIENEQHKDDVIAGPSTMLQSSAINNSPQISLYVPSRTPTPTNISPRTLDSTDTLSGTPTLTKDFSWSSSESRVPTRATKTKRLFIYIFICQSFF